MYCNAYKWKLKQILVAKVVLVSSGLLGVVATYLHTFLKKFVQPTWLLPLAILLTFSIETNAILLKTEDIDWFMNVTYQHTYKED